MLWSLTKVLAFILAILALAYFGAILLESEGGMVITFGGWEFSLGPFASVVFAFLAALAVWLVIRIFGLISAIIRFATGDETALSRYFDRNRERKGYEALAEGMLALASGEGRLALARAQRAEKYLARPELTTLLLAQAAEVVGDTKRASDAYKVLLTEDKTRFVGLRGLLKQKLADGDTETALLLAEKAFALRPRHSETQDVLLKLQAEKSDWKGARATLGAKLKSGELPRDVYRRRDAVLALQEAKGVMDESASIDAREAAIEANRLSPDLIPAAAMAARGLAEKGDKKGATRVLKKAWTAQPHPDLAAAFADLEPDETPADRVKRFAPFLKLAADAEESRLVQAELLIAAEDFPAARRALGDLAESHPTQRVLAIMAAIARGEGESDDIVRAWLTRALSAPRGPQWCCDKCQAIHAQWLPICPNCQGFDTLSWREPVQAEGGSATGAELLPLITGAGTKPPASADPDEN